MHSTTLFSSLPPVYVCVVGARSLVLVVVVVVARIAVVRLKIGGLLVG